MSKIAKTVGVLFAAGTVVVVLYWHSEGSPAPSETKTAVQVNKVGSGSSSPSAPIRPTPNAALVSGPPLAVSANPYLQEALTTANRKSTFDRLATSSDPVAAHTAAMLADACSLYADNTYAATLRRIDSSRESVAVKDTQRAVATRERSRCIGFDTEAYRRAAELRRFVLNSGDPRGVLSSLPVKAEPIPEQIAKAQEAARLTDPLALMDVGMFFTGRSDVQRGALFDIGNGISVPTTMIRDAFFLAACNYGGDCGAQGGMVSARCVSVGWCDASSFEESLMRYTYTPADADKLNAARQVVMRGIQTGQWPANFWNTPR